MLEFSFRVDSPGKQQQQQQPAPAVILSPNRSVEDLKERYYAISGKLVQIRSPRPGGADEKAYVFDADHERKRKEQLRRLWDRTPEAIEEEQVRKSTIPRKKV